MLEKISKNQKVKLIGSFISTTLLGLFVVLVIFVYLNSTYGWFANNRHVDGKNMQVSVEAAQAEAEYMVYLFDAKKNGVRYTGDGEENDPKIEDLKMQVHDIIFKSRNRYTPALYHIHLSEIKDEFRTRDGVVSITFARDGTAALDTSSATPKLTQKTSSVLRFTLINNKGTSWLSSDPDPDVAAKYLFDTADAALYSKIVTSKNYSDTADLDLDSKVFVSSLNPLAKNSTITLSVAYTAAQVAGGELDLFVYLTYDEDLVSAIENTIEMGTGGTSVGKITTLPNDISSLTISFQSSHS